MNGPQHATNAENPEEEEVKIGRQDARDASNPEEEEKE
jgi:hypothetical protein